MVCFIGSRVYRGEFAGKVGRLLFWVKESVVDSRVLGRAVYRVLLVCFVEYGECAYIYICIHSSWFYSKKETIC